MDFNAAIEIFLLALIRSYLNFKICVYLGVGGKAGGQRSGTMK